MHLQVLDTSICATRCVEEYNNPCTRFCPANVYEMVADTTSPSGKRLQINAANCVHCKTCDIKDPYEIITWVTRRVVRGRTTRICEHTRSLDPGTRARPLIWAAARWVSCHPFKRCNTRPVA